MKSYWCAGVICLIVLLIIDKKFTDLGAYSFNHGNYYIANIPVLYWTSFYAAGVLSVYYFPKQKKWQLPYILFLASIFLVLETVMNRLGYFHYHQWSPIDSFVLNISGISLVLWFSQLCGLIKNQDY
ncbi:MAG: CBO0543 family protein [Bacillota bacterium]